jgi:hypothetical protein
VPDLIVSFGPPAAGKAAVGHELAKLTGFRFFHNHMTAEPVAALFGWGTESFAKLADQLRITLFTEAIAQPNMPNSTFTFVWALDLEGDWEFIKKVVALFEANGGKVFFVELVASLPARLQREGTPLRLSLKPSKHNVQSARALLVEGKYKLNSTNDFPYPEHHLVLNIEQCSALECAQRIAAHWCFNAAST